MDFKVGSIQVANMNRYQDVRKKSVQTAAIRQEADKVDFSGSKALFSQALNAAKETPDVRSDRVDAIKTAVSNGTYRVDSRAIAEKMLGL